MRATIRNLTNQLKKLAPGKTTTHFPTPKIRQLTSEKFDQLSARMYFFRHSIIRSFCEKSQEIEDLKPHIYTLAEDSRNNELIIIQQFLQDLSIAGVECPGIAYQWTYLYEDEEQPCLEEEKCNRRSEHFGRCQCNLDFSICLCQINLATFEPLEIEIRGKTCYQLMLLHMDDALPLHKVLNEQV